MTVTDEMVDLALRAYWENPKYKGDFTNWADEARDGMRKALTAALSDQVVEANGWQDISTAPKDGTPVDLWSPTKGRLVDSKWVSELYCKDTPWGWSNHQFGRITDATHWRLPPSPAVGVG